MKTKISALKNQIVMTLLMGASVGLGGCADYASVGVGYSGAYYVPDYRPFYAEYYYDGLPWWGPNYYYSKNKIVVKDVDRQVNVNRNLYYGGHHFAPYGRGRVAAIRANGRVRLHRRG